MVLDILAMSALALTLFGMPMFAMFIMEEAIQVIGFGVFMLVNGKVWERAVEQLDIYDKATDELDRIVTNFKKLVGGPDILKEWYTKANMEVAEGEDTLITFIQQIFFKPYEEYVKAARSYSLATRAMIAEKYEPAKAGFYVERSVLRDNFNKAKFTFKQLLDTHLDNMRLARDKDLDDLRLEKDTEKDALRIERKQKLPTDYFTEKEAIVVWYMREKRIIKEAYDAQIAVISDKYRLLINELYNKFVTQQITFEEWLAQATALSEQQAAELAPLEGAYFETKVSTRVEYDTRKHDLAVTMKAERKAYRMSDEEYNTLERAIVARYNDFDRTIKAGYNDIDRNLRKQQHDDLELLETTYENNITALREKYFPIAKPLEEVELEKRMVIVYRAIDGDTIETGTGERVRLLGIDAPEMSETWGPESKGYLWEQVVGQAVKLWIPVADPKDVWDRTLAVVFKAGVNICIEMLKAGWAKVYYRYGNPVDSRLWQPFEDEAKAAKLGMWAELPEVFDVDIHASAEDG